MVPPENRQGWSDSEPSFLYFARSLDTEELLTRIRDFWQQPLHVMNEDDLKASLFVAIAGSPDAEIHLANNVEVLPSGSRAFRGRTIPEEFVGAIADFCMDKSQFGPPPCEGVKAGRLNAAGESVLYLTLGDAWAVPDEIGVELGQHFALASMRLCAPIRVIEIVPRWDMTSLERQERINLGILSDFLTRLFMVPSGKSSQYAYDLARIVRDFFFPLDRFAADGWLYPSTFGAKKKNLALPRIGSSKLFRLESTGCYKYVDDGLRKATEPEVIYVRRDGTVHAVTDKMELESLIPILLGGRTIRVSLEEEGNPVNR